MDRKQVTIKMRVEAVLAGTFAVLAVVTMLWPSWIETTTRLEPDAGSGATEWGVVVVLAFAAVGAAVLARRDHRVLEGLALTRR